MPLVKKEEVLTLIANEMWDIDEWEPPYKHYSGNLLNDIQIGLGVAWNIHDSIEKMEEVKAIPIEWINSWILEQYNRQHLGTEKVYVWEMVEDWEKENESNIDN